MITYPDPTNGLGPALVISGLFGLVVAISVAYGKKNYTVFWVTVALLLGGIWLGWFYMPTGDLTDCFERGLTSVAMIVFLGSSFCCLDPRPQFVRIIEGKKTWQRIARTVTIASMIIFILGVVGQGRF